MLLERRGWRVRSARDGAEACRLFAAHEAEIALVMLDCRLPDQTGAEISASLRARVPELPVIFMSGRNQLQLAASRKSEGPTAFLPKPFFPGDVDRAVHALLPAIA
jgi:two-component system OmpR family response regulator